MKLLLLIFCILSFTLSQAQNYELQSDQTKLTVEGTSTLHDWDMDATEFEGTANIVLNNGELEEIRSLTFKVPVKSLKSGTSGMDNDAYEALQAEKHPLITYEFTAIESMQKEGRKLFLDTKGRLTIAGETHTLNMEVQADTTKDIHFSGDVSFKMTDFGIEPPTSLFGSLKAGNAITVKFNATYAK